ncbi:MAG TPA: hypothetical protein VIM56_13160 [Rhizomicrobium sp.]
MAILPNDPVYDHIPALTLHIVGGGLGILSGYAAILAAKGERMHLLFGKIFVLGMVMMATAAIWLGSMLTVLKPMELANIGMGSIILYLISTSWMAVRRTPGTIGAFETFALVAGAAISATFLYWGLRAQVPGGFDGYGPTFYFVAGGIMALFATFDLKMVVQGGVRGSARIARHLLRMSTAWFIACTSFFEGQQKSMPAAIHGSRLLLLPAFAPLGFMLFWYIRVRIVPRFRRAVPA